MARMMKLHVHDAANLAELLRQFPDGTVTPGMGDVGGRGDHWIFTADPVIDRAEEPATVSKGNQRVIEDELTRQLVPLATLIGQTVVRQFDIISNSISIAWMSRMSEATEYAGIRHVVTGPPIVPDRQLTEQEPGMPTPIHRKTLIVKDGELMMDPELLRTLRGAYDQHEADRQEAARILQEDREAAAMDRAYGWHKPRQYITIEPVKDESTQDHYQAWFNCEASGRKKLFEGTEEECHAYSKGYSDCSGGNIEPGVLSDPSIGQVTMADGFYCWPDSRLEGWTFPNPHLPVDGGLKLFRTYCRHPVYGSVIGEGVSPSAAMEDGRVKALDQQQKAEAIKGTSVRRPGEDAYEEPVEQAKVGDPDGQGYLERPSRITESGYFPDGLGA